MLYSPDWFQGGWIICPAWDYMPVNMREPIAKEFIIDLLGLVDFRQNFGDEGDLFDQLNTFGRCQLE
jgi:hypothetical protein